MLHTLRILRLRLLLLESLLLITAQFFSFSLAFGLSFLIQIVQAFLNGVALAGCGQASRHRRLSKTGLTKGRSEHATILTIFHIHREHLHILSVNNRSVVLSGGDKFGLPLLFGL